MSVIKPDATLVGAVGVAHTSLVDVADPGTVGDHLGVQMEADRLATHRFACTAAAYRGWTWAVTVARAPRSRKVTVCEINLLPDDDALLAPAWVPYAERIAPGDLGPGDVLPYAQDDPNLQSGFEATGDEDVDELAQWELGLGRARVLSPEGRERAAQRWYEGRHGPKDPVAERARAHCGTCGYYLPLAGGLRLVFGVCANAWSPSDGQVVSLDHGCGAHSETDTPSRPPVTIPPPLVDDLVVDVLQ